tara:strand:+ start:2694 stop:3002 length:309 start_codon:yes stop_codon:yes gene_type:complete
MPWPETKIIGQVGVPGPHRLTVEALVRTVPMEHHLPLEVVEATTAVVCLPLEAINQGLLHLVEITAVLRAAPVPEATVAVAPKVVGQVEATGVQVVAPEVQV